MELKSNREIQGAYENLMESMTVLVRSRTDAFSILWLDIYDWLELEMKSDLCGILTERVIGKNLAGEVYGPASDMPYCQEIQRKYAFGKSIDELGEYWKETIREEKSFRLRLLLGCLDTYYNTIMPYVKSEMVAVGNEWVKGHPEMLLMLNLYRKHRATVKATMQIIETVLGVFALQDKVENDCEEI